MTENSRFSSQSGRFCLTAPGGSSLQSFIAWLPPKTPVEREAESSRQLTVLGEERCSGEETAEHGPGCVIRSVQSCL